jgi:hypothetical protein
MKDATDIRRLFGMNFDDAPALLTDVINQLRRLSVMSAEIAVEANWGFA